MSCSGLNASIADIDVRIIEVQGEDKTTGQNTAAGIVGAIIFWPALFALDISDDEKIEIDAYRRRRTSLRRIMVEKECPQIPKEVKVQEEKKPTTTAWDDEDDD